MPGACALLAAFLDWVLLLAAAGGRGREMSASPTPLCEHMLCSQIATLEMKMHDNSSGVTHAGDHCDTLVPSSHLCQNEF